MVINNKYLIACIFTVFIFNLAKADMFPTMLPPPTSSAMGDADKKIINEELKTATCRYVDTSKSSILLLAEPTDPPYKMVPSPGCLGEEKQIPMISGVVRCSGKTIGDFFFREVICFPRAGPGKKIAAISAKDCVMQNYFDYNTTDGGNVIYQQSKKIEGIK